jgi:solute carrier family 25 carnitine/acylcarnitine transporter 20/29
MLSPLFVVSAINACLFAFYGATQKAILKANNIEEHQMSFAQTALCGSVAGVACAPLSGPMELIKSQLQVQRGRADAKYMGTFKFTNHLVRTHGFAALGRGLGATVVREAPAYAMFYGVYFTGKRKLAAAYPNASAFAVQVPAACLAGLGYWTSCYPIDVAKSVMQTEPLGKLPYKNKNVFSTMASIYRSEGVPGLFRGIGPCYLRALPAGTATFVTYEAVRKALG